MAYCTLRFALVALTVVGCTAPAPDEEPVALVSPELASPKTKGLALSVHTTLGLPEEAKPNDPQNALLVKSQYVSAYDSTRKNPRWVSWELTGKWLGSADRVDAWTTDPGLGDLPQAELADYAESGFQRGHLCPSADRTKNPSDNRATFFLTNAVPQAAESNTGAWLTLENDERKLARAGQNHLFVVAGPIYSGKDREVGKGVSVPSSMFKVIVVLEGDRPLPSDVTASTHVIAVEVPNDATARGTYKKFTTSIAAIEKKTGFRLLSDVDASVHDSLASRTDSL